MDHQRVSFIKGLLILFHEIVKNLPLFTGKSKLVVHKNCHTGTLFIGADLELRLGTCAKFSLVYRYLHVYLYFTYYYTCNLLATLWNEFIIYVICKTRDISPLTPWKDISMLKQETQAYEELAKQLFLESVDLHNAQVNH